MKKLSDFKSPMAYKHYLKVRSEMATQLLSGILANYYLDMCNEIPIEHSANMMVENAIKLTDKLMNKLEEDK